MLGRQKKHTLLRHGSRCNTCTPLIDRNMFVPNWPHGCGFLAKACWMPHLRPVKLIVSRSLPFVRRPCHARDPIDGRISTKFHGVVKEDITFNSSPPVRVPTKCGQFTVEKKLSPPSCLSSLPPSGVSKFNMVEKAGEFPSGLPHSLNHLECVPIVYHLTLRGKEKMVIFYARGDKVLCAL